MRRPYKHIELDDKFSEFEFSPNDSNWDKISGGLNPKMAAGNLADKFSEFAVPPAKNIWNSVNQEINPDSRKKFLAFWWQAGVAAAVLLAITFGYSDLSNEAASAYNPREHSLTNLDFNGYNNLNSDAFFTNQNSNTSELNFLEEKTTIPALDDYNKSLDFPSKFDLISKNSFYSAHKSQNSLNSAGVTLTKAIAEKDSTIIIKVEKDFLHPKMADFSEGSQLADIKNSPVSVSSNYVKSPWELKLKRQFSEKTTEVYASSSWTDLAIDDESFLIENQNSVLAGDYFSDINSLRENGFVSAEKFEMPISLSVSGEIHLKESSTRRLKLGLGLGYLGVKSSKTTTPEQSTLEANLKQIETTYSRKYLTLPVYLKYNFLDKRKIDAYIKLGSTAEAGISGTSSEQIKENNVVTERVNSKFKLGTGQINVNSGLGTDIHITNTLHGFVEFNLAHYFSESQYTYWSNQKLWPSISTGLSLRIN